VEIELNNPKKMEEDISRLLGQRLKMSVTLKGHTLLVPDITAKGYRLKVKDLKLYVKHVLHQLNLSDDFRVLTDRHRIRIVKIKKKVHHAQREGTAPPPSQTLPYLFPS
jgi:hypothetical protein